jgi:hypothetical protein
MIGKSHNREIRQVSLAAYLVVNPTGQLQPGQDDVTPERSKQVSTTPGQQRKQEYKHERYNNRDRDVAKIESYGANYKQQAAKHQPPELTDPRHLPDRRRQEHFSVLPIPILLR